MTLDYGGATPTTYQSLLPFLQAAIQAQAVVNPVLADIVVGLIGDGSVALPYRFVVGAAPTGGVVPPTTQITFAGGVSGTLQLSGAGVAVANVQFAPAGAGLGGDGLPADAAAMTGIRANKTGLYALEEADLFNILCIPAAAGLAATGMQAVYSAAEAYCRERRAFMILDVPAAIDDPGAMQAFLAANATLRDRNGGDLLPPAADPGSAQRLPAADRRGQRDDGRRLCGDRHRPRRLEGAGRDRSATAGRVGARLRPHRRRERDAQPARHQCAPQLRRLRQRRLGRAGRSTAPTSRPRSGSTSRSGAWPCISRRACTAAPSGSSSSRTTSRCGRRSGSTSAPSCTTCS